MITRRTWAAGPLLLLAGLTVGLVLAAPAGATEPGPAYPPGAGADDVVQAGGGTGTGGTGGPASADDGGTAGPDPAAAYRERMNGQPTERWCPQIYTFF